MKQTHAGTGHGLAGFTFFCAAIIATAQAQAVGTNTVPSVWHFEGLAPGTAVVDTNGVGTVGFEGTPFSSSNNAAEVVTLTPSTPPNGFAVTNPAAHNQVIQVLGDVTANFDTAQTQGNTNVLIDVLVQAGQLAFEPDVPLGAQVGAYFNTNGHLVLRHALYTNDFGNAGPALSHQWTEMSHTPVGSNDWVRLTIIMDYLSAGPLYSPQEHYFAVLLNGNIISSPSAYNGIPLDTPDGYFPEPAAPGSTNMWFLCADSGFGDQTGENSPNNNFFSAIEFDGAGNVDDIVVSLPGGAPPCPPCANPFQCWLEQFYPCPGPVYGEGDDPDNDGLTNFEEYIAGTNPADVNSKFKTTNIQRTGTSNLVAWVGTTNSGVFTEYSVYRSTNMLNPSGWVLVASNLARSASGTNYWYDTTPPGTNAFYRPALPTNAP